MKSIIRKSRIKLVFSGMLFTLLGGSNILFADDTEIFFGAQTAQSTSYPNVLFILDTSGSMDSKDGTGITRLDRMKDAVTQIIDTATNINVGMMRFNGYDSGGPILFPITYIDKELCPNGICNGGDPNVSLSIRVSSSMDDVSEKNNSLSISTNDEVLGMFRSPDSYNETTRTYPVKHERDQAEQRVDNGYFMLGSYDLDGFYDDNWQNTEQVFGLRFPDIDIPAAATILQSKVIIQADPGLAQGLTGALIYGEDRLDPPRFENSNGYRVLDRAKTSEYVSWSDIPFPVSSNNGLLETPDLTTIIASRIAQSGWHNGDAIALLFENDDSVAPANRYHFRRFIPYGYTSDEPKLEITYSTGTPQGQKIGLRFNDVRIPQGATITDASIEFTSAGSASVTTNATITAHDADNAPAFTTSNGNLTGRTKTSANVTWSPGNWSGAGSTYQTPSLTSVVQEVVNRSGWCGGNSLALLLEGTGLRDAIAFDRNPNEAPVLKVSYDATTIPAGGGCNVAQAISSIAVSSDDVEQSSSGYMSFTSSDLELPRDGSSEQVIGLRFRDLKIPHGATVTNAKLTFEIDEEKTGSTSLYIEGEANPDPANFSNVRYNLSNRTKTSARVDWNALPELGVNEKLVSPDISTVIQEIVDNPGWSTGNNMVLLLSRKSGTDTRTVEAYDGEPTEAATLTVSYHVSGASNTTGTDQVVYMTTRDKLKQVLQDMKTAGGTPSVGALYEAALYYKGLDVDYGKERGLGNNKHQYHRVSHPQSYTGGALNRPSGCTDDDLNNYSCKQEKITGTATYISPMNDVCQTNHIVMLSDGQPTSDEAVNKVKSMIGSNSCANRSYGTCGEELADYLKNNDQTSDVAGMQDITTYTIGFNFTSDWMRDVATAGGGSFYEAASSDQLVSAFNNILSEILKVDTSFVSPGATVNQFNRLTHRNDIYFSLFKPSEKPTWSGNLKQYRLAGNPSRLVDANGNEAVDESTGFFKDTAKSFWSENVDGSDVAAGGAANELTLTNRKVFTNVSPSLLLSASSNILHESNSYLNKDLFDISGQSDAYYSDLVKWARGVDVKDANNDGNYSDIRKHLGDPMHSRPTIINYSETDSVVFFGTNEGFLHAIDTDDGSEVFSFIPSDLLPNLDKFYTNHSSIDHPYGLDGTVTYWKNPSTDKIYLYIGMRRGGNKYYALDVTNKNEPKLKWIIDGDTNPDFASLGQTWSKAEPTQVRIGGTIRNVLIFAGGYDTNQDNVTSITPDSVGNSIYMVDAITGSLVWSAGLTGSGATETFSDMQYSMPADVTIVDTDLDKDRIADQLYIGDMGGQIWRFDINKHASSASDLVTGGVMAKLSGSGIQDARRFYYSPDIALISTNGNASLAISIGSGWRAHPLDLEVQDRFYMIKSNAIYSAPAGYGKDNGNGNFSPITESDLQDVTDDLEADMSSSEGWRLDMEMPGEKVLSKSVTINNQVVFTSYRPEQAATACSTSLGGGAVYTVSVIDGSPTINLDGHGSDEDLTKNDRVSELSHGGIPPEAIALFPSDVDNGNGIDPILLIGPEQFDLNFGNLTQRTFWQSN
ncbi:MAG: VWA domain-containing protein [Gammaproteobacteria bacterium]|nr:VWA domain-containing protein [Gammaproteobacteria bacterium]